MKISNATLSIVCFAGLSVGLAWHFSAVSEMVSPAAVGQHRITVVDDIGRTVNLPQPIRRVVVFQRSVAELIRAVGADDTIVGMTRPAALVGTEYWPRVDALTLVGEQQREPDYERIVELRPDVVIGEGIGNWEENVRRLDLFGIPFVAIEGGWDQRAYTNSIRLLGQMFDEPEGARRVLDFHEGMRRLIAERLEGVDTRRIAYFETTGRRSAHVTALPGSGWHDMVETGGGRNLFGHLDFASFRGQGSVHNVTIDPEAVVLGNPEVVVKLDYGSTAGGYHPPSQADLRDTYEWLATRPGWDRLPAVRHGRILVLSNFAANVSGKMLGSMYVAKWAYPERLEDVDPDAFMRTWLEEFQGVPYLGPYHYQPPPAGP